MDNRKAVPTISQDPGSTFEAMSGFEKRPVKRYMTTIVGKYV
jgi:hypothetical protein